jgi:hypothetical protein
MADDDTQERLRASARRVLRARRGRGDDRRKPNWPLEIVIGLAIVAVLATGVVLVEAHIFG